MTPKFRAWDKETERMWDIDAWHIADEYVDLIEPGKNIADISAESFWRKQSEIILMQAIGLLNCETEDGKNVEGWEGDIADVGWSEQTGDFNSHRIILKSPFDYSTDEAIWLIHAEYIIIRGNIYENPELLEETE
ncbi:TPA: YopX family protein [Enterococcus faecium]|uniref:YopX family protein n=1 Tax=Enterococcus TaxID=1350 RepID=UPI000D59D3AF|nr:YopX family protein [Enterococcus sp. H57]